MDDFDRPATQDEAYREMVGNIGIDCPDREWILTPYDTWERNPSYTGPRGPHPEEPDLYDISGLEAGEISDEELDALTKPETSDNMPF